MSKFIRFYALEIYTVISMLILLVAGFMDDLSTIQKFSLVYIFLFILHEWEEMSYPGGFADLISNMLGVDINVEMKRASRIPTSILLLTFTVVPFVLHEYPITILPLAFLGLFEGLVHILAIKLFKCPKCYSPGFVTAEIQAIVTVVLFTYLIKNNILTGTQYIIGAVVMFACFVIMQKTITMMIGYRYSDVFKNIRKQWQK